MVETVKQRRKKIYGLTAGCIGLLVLLVFIYLRLNSLGGPAIAQLHNLKRSSRLTNAAFNFNPVRVNAKYISFSYPQSLAADNSAQKPLAPILSSYTYKYNDLKAWVLTVSVVKLSSNNLLADSSYYARYLDPKQYNLASVSFGKNTFQLMTDRYAAGFSKVAYSLNNGLAAEISLTGDDASGTANLSKAFAGVLASFRWN